MNWMSRVASNMKNIMELDSYNAKVIIHLYCMLCEYDNGTLLQYLTNSYPENNFYFLKSFFFDRKKNDLVCIFDEIEDIYGEKIPDDAEERSVKIFNMSSFESDEDDPFYYVNIKFLEQRQDIDSIANELLSQILQDDCI